MTDSPAAGNVEEVLARVASGEVTARAALDAEQAKGDNARSTLVEKLTAVADIEAPASSGRVLIANVNVAGTVYRQGTADSDLPTEVADQIGDHAWGLADQDG